MGGFGSGRPLNPNAKKTTDYYLSVDIRQWQRNRYITELNGFIWRWYDNLTPIASMYVEIEKSFLMFSSVLTADSNQKVSADEMVQLDWTACNYGNRRPWFRCPVAECNRRVAILYIGNYISCRHCKNLAYLSQKESNKTRLLRKIKYKRSNLGWSEYIYDFSGSKPKHMHRSTYLLESLRCIQLSNAYLLEFSPLKNKT